MGDEAIIALANYLPQSKLQVLNLANNRWSLVGTTALANALERTHTLEYLDLRENKIGPKGAVILAEKVKENISLKPFYWIDVKNGKKLVLPIDY